MPKGKYKPFTSEDEQKIKDEYLDKPVKRLAEELGVSGGRITRFLDKHGLVIPREIIEQRIRDSRFKKSHSPFNKGRKRSEWMTEDKIKKCKKTAFKPGHIPHNVHPDGDGAIVKRKDKSGRWYKYIRTDLSTWELYHRYVWVQEYGTIPEGHIIRFKNGNSLDVRLDNLELITKVENMYRNSVHDYPDEVIPSMTLVNKLDKKLNKLEND